MSGLPGLSLDRSYVEPGSYPHVLNAEEEPGQNLNRQRQHDDEERLHHHILENAHARVDLAIERRPGDQLVAEDRRGHGIDTGYDSAEDDLTDLAVNAEDVGQVAIDLEDQPVVIPRHSRPKPHPPRTADESADHDHRDP